MTLDKNTMQMILSLPDDQLSFIIKRLAKESGVDLSGVSFSSTQLKSLRDALSVATDDDIARAAEIIKEMKHKH